jgi:hypothetical protein
LDGVKVSKETAFNGTVNTTYTSPTHLRSGEFKTTTDVVTRGFRRKMNAGEIINNPFYSQEIKRTKYYTGHKVRRKSGSGSTIQYYEGDNLYGSPDPVPSPSVDVTALRALAGTQAAANVLKPDIDGLVEVAEFREAVRLFDLKRNLLDLHLKDILKAKGVSRFGLGTRVIANNWLKYRYGIMPLVRLCDQALHLGKEPKPLRLVARGSASDSASRSDTVSDNGGNFWNVSFAVDQTLEVSVRAGVLYEIIQSHNRYGFNFSDLPAAAWELVPYSFVVDWFSNVGNFIRGVTPKVGARVLASWTSVKTIHTAKWDLNATWKASSSTFEEQLTPGGGSDHVTTTVRRTPGISKKVVFNRPSVKAIPTDKRFIDALALTLQKFLS